MVGRPGQLHRGIHQWLFEFTKHLPDLLPNAIEHAKRDVLGVVASNVHALYGDRLAVLGGALLAARQANTALAKFE